MDTDMPNWGKDGNWDTGRFIVQDAYVRLHLHEAFNIMAGMFLVPFSRNFITGAAKLHVMDYHTFLAKYPTPPATVMRDNGILFTGLLANKKLEYRLALTNGLGGTPDDIPRLLGRVSYNVFDPEGAFFPVGANLGKSRVLSVGLAADFQKDGKQLTSDPADPATFADYLGLSLDVFWDLPLGNNTLTGTAAFLYYGPNENPQTGIGSYLDLGYAIGNIVEPVISVQWYKPKETPNGFKDHTLAIYPGINYWLHEHAASIKFELRLTKIGLLDAKTGGVDFSEMVIAPTVQTQIFF
jgi:hypothetical protein